MASPPRSERLFKPAGLENAKGIISDTSFKDPTDPQWHNDAGYQQWLAFMDKYYPDGDKTDNQTVYGYSIAQTTVQVLKQCGDDLTRENVMKQCASMHNFELPMLLPGVAINTSPSDFQMIKQAQMRRLDRRALRWFVQFYLRGRAQLTGLAVAAIQVATANAIGVLSGRHARAISVISARCHRVADQVYLLQREWQYHRCPLHTPPGWHRR